MKFACSLLLCWQLCQARPVIVLTYRHKQNRVHTIMQALIGEMNFPAPLVESRRQSPPCRRIEEAIVHLCLDDNGTLKAPQIRRDILARNLRAFYLEEKK